MVEIGGDCSVGIARSSFDTVDTLTGLDDTIATSSSSSRCANFPPGGCCGEVSIPSTEAEEVSASRMAVLLIVDRGQLVAEVGTASSSGLSTMLSPEGALHDGSLSVSGGQDRWYAERSSTALVEISGVLSL